MNPTAIQTALARFAALKGALGSAAGKAGNFIADEARGTLANLSPSAVAQRYQAVDQARADEADSLARANGFPNAAAVNALHPDLPQTDMLTEALGKAYGLARRIKNKI